MPGDNSSYNFEFDANLVVYPNPTSDKIVITSIYDIDKIGFYSMLRKKVLETANKNEIDINSLSNGVYILQIYLGKTKLIKRISKQ